MGTSVADDYVIFTYETNLYNWHVVFDLNLIIRKWSFQKKCMVERLWFICSKSGWCNIKTKQAGEIWIRVGGTFNKSKAFKC